MCFFRSHSHFKIIPCPAQKPALTFWDRPRSVYGICISLNKSPSYLSLCLSLNSFCDQTRRTWASESPDTGWERFYLKDSEFDSQSELRDSVCGFKSHSGFRLGSSPISEKAMAPHSSTLAWKIPWTEEPGRLQSMGLLRVRYDWATSLSLFTLMHWRRKWQPTPVFLPGESQGRGSLVGCRLWGHTELDTTEAT